MKTALNLPKSLTHPITGIKCRFKELTHGDSLARYEPDEGGLGLYLPATHDTPEVEFMSNCYPGHTTGFVISVKGRGEGESEEYIEPVLEQARIRFQTIAEDSYDFPGKTPKEMHSVLAAMGFVYTGPVDTDALDTSK